MPRCLLACRFDGDWHSAIWHIFRLLPCKGTHFFNIIASKPRVFIVLMIVEYEPFTLDFVKRSEKGWQNSIIFVST